jgi:hypothetical protein
MPAVGGVPSLSQIQCWTADYLIEAADHWKRSAVIWSEAYDDAFREVQSPGGSHWVGAGAEAAKQLVDGDRSRVAAAVDDLHVTATMARAASSDLTATRANLLNAVAAAEADGFTVGEDYSVRSVQRGLSPADAAARKALAETHAAAIRSGVFALAALDKHAAASITTAAAGVQSMSFGSDGGGARQNPVQATDWKTGPFPHQPPPRDPGLPQPPGGWSDDPVMEDAQRIAYGHAWQKHPTDWKNLTQDQLADLVHGMLTGDPRTDAGLHVGQVPGRSSTAIYKDGILVIHDPLTGDGGTVYRPINGYDEFLRLIGGAGAAPIVTSPPNIPPTVPHVPMGPMPLQPPHVPVNLPPSGIFDPNGLPPWLANPSPPAMPYSPQGPLIMPGVPLQSAPMASPAPAPGSGSVPHIDLSPPPNLGGDLAGAGQTTGPVAAAGGLSLLALLALLLPS